MTCGSGVPASATDAPALGEVDFDEGAMAAAESAEGMQRLDDARALRPTAADAAGQRHHGDGSLGEGFQADPPQRFHLSGKAPRRDVATRRPARRRGYRLRRAGDSAPGRFARRAGRRGSVRAAHGRNRNQRAVRSSPLFSAASLSPRGKRRSKRVWTMPANAGSVRQARPKRLSSARLQFA